MRSTIRHATIYGSRPVTRERHRLYSLKGLGRAVAVALAREDVDFVINARSPDALKAAAEQIRAENDVDVIPIAADITTEVGLEAVLAACLNPDILINNAGWTAA